MFKYQSNPNPEFLSILLTANLSEVDLGANKKKERFLKL